MASAISCCLNPGVSSGDANDPRPPAAPCGLAHPSAAPMPSCQPLPLPSHRAVAEILRRVVSGQSPQQVRTQPKAPDRHSDGEDHGHQHRPRQLVQALEHRLVHPKPKTQTEVQCGGCTEGRKQGADRARREGGGEPVGRDALGQQGDQRIDNASTPEAGAYGRGGGIRSGGIHGAVGKSTCFAPSR